MGVDFVGVDLMGMNHKIIDGSLFVWSLNLLADLWYHQHENPLRFLKNTQCISGLEWNFFLPNVALNLSVFGVVCT